MHENKRPHLFWALLHNELEKLWAHRGRTLIIALALLVLGGSFLTWHGQQSQQHAIQSYITQMRTQVAQDHKMIAHASSGQKQALESRLQNDQQALKAAESQGINGAVNVRAEIHAYQASLKSTHGSNRGNDMEQLALMQYRIHHGIKTYSPGVENGFHLTGAVFGGLALVLLALVGLILSSDTVSSELEAGTWGVLLLHAPRRRLVYLAKLGASLTTVWSFMVASAIGFFVVGGLLMGFGGAEAPHAVGLRVLAIHQGPSIQVLPAIQTFHILPQWSYDIMALVLAMLAIGGLVALFIAVSMATRSTVISMIVGAVVTVSGLMAGHLAGSLAIVDPAFHLPLMADWTRTTAMQNGIPSASLATGLIVVLAWSAAAVLFSVWYARKLDV